MRKLLWKATKFSQASLVNVLLISNLAQAAEPLATTTSNNDSVESVILESIDQYTEITNSVQQTAAVPQLSQDVKLTQQPVAQLMESTTPSAEVESAPQLEEATLSQEQSVTQLEETDLLGVEVEGDPSQLPGEAEWLNQVTNVSQLSDVRPTDWAYEALRSLVERYGCIAGYPDGTFRGNRALSRYEFAAGLNACLTQIEKLIAASTGEFVTKEDLVTLQKLVDEFSAELATLRTRVDNLEGRVKFLEDHQFSTTTKLALEVITYLSDGYGENADDVNNPSLGHRTRIDFNTSFTGKDRLRTRFQMTNLRLVNTGATFGGNLGAGTEGATGETRFTPSSVSQDGDVLLSILEYRFTIGDKLTVFLEANTVDPSYTTDTVSSFIDTATQGISNFGQVNPVFFPIGNQAGLALSYAVNKAFTLDLGYFGEGAGASQKGRPNDPSEDSGLFQGGYSAYAHLIFKPNDTFKIGFLYLNSYSQENGVDTLAGSNAAKVIDVQTFSTPVVGNNYGIQSVFRPFPQLELGGWVGYTSARALGNGVKGDADVWNWAVTLALPDLFKKGNLGGFVFGMQPRLTDTDNSILAQRIGLPAGQRKDRDVGYHIEAFYRFQLNDYISITPGVIWLTAPNHDERNPDAVIGVIRSSFVF